VTFEEGSERGAGWNHRWAPVLVERSAPRKGTGLVTLFMGEPIGWWAELRGRVARAKEYARFIKSLAVWGHGPVDVAFTMASLLDGGEMPKDAKEWLAEQPGRKEEL